MKGTVKWFNNEKGYGCIVKDEYDDIFVHDSAIKINGYRTMAEGEIVDFELVEGDKGVQETDVE